MIENENPIQVPNQETQATHEHESGNRHHPHHHEEHKHFPKGAWKVAASVIIGSLLICASIFYNAGLLVKSISAIQVRVAGSSNAAQAPAGPVSVTVRSDQPTLGNKSAKVTIYEFADFQCPFCQNFFNETFAQIKSEYIDTGKVQYVFRHFPLSFHVNAQISAVAAECANQQDKFWPYHDLLYKNSKSDGKGLAATDLKKYADQLGLNKGILGLGKNKFNQCLDKNATLQTVKDDQAEGARVDVSGTPTFYINGQKVVGAQPFTKFKEAVDAALKE